MLTALLLYAYSGNEARAVTYAASYMQRRWKNFLKAGRCCAETRARAPTPGRCLGTEFTSRPSSGPVSTA
eukprot:15483314-Alexandrium_andersonii.AAC.1